MKIWTVGHSNRSVAELIEILQVHQIKSVVDVRSWSGSKANPQFNGPPYGEVFPEQLAKAGITFHQLPELGGRRKSSSTSKNVRWRNPAFRGYADYMETNDFSAAIKRLRRIARKERTAIMCSEAVWWRCHRSMVADYLKTLGDQVLHIMSKYPTSTKEHPYTSVAKVERGRLTYR